MTRTVTVALALGVLASSTLLASGGNAAGQDPMYRKVEPPNVKFPILGARSVKDLKNFSSSHRGTDIRTPCKRGVYATHPGTAQVLKNPRAYHKNIVRVVSNSGGLVTTAAYLVSASVTNGQIIQSGQMIGKAGRKSAKTPCGIYFAVRNAGKVVNPSTWLNTWVGRPPPVSNLFGTTGFNVA
jgi:murein DD-endopeptidase MepM/ murein hydrolase activator NlpD